MEEEFYIGTNKVFLTHGHQYRISVNEDLILDEAKARGANILIYGHTHRPEIDDSQPGLLILNPGSISLPRQTGRKKSYMVLELESGKEPEVWLRYL